MYERIKNIMEEMNLKPAIVERDLGWGNGSIKKLETSSPSVSKVIDLANYLNVSISYLITGKMDNDSLKEDEIQLIGMYKQLSEKNKIRLIERAESLLSFEQD